MEKAQDLKKLILKTVNNDAVLSNKICWADTENFWKRPYDNHFEIKFVGNVVRVTFLRSKWVVYHRATFHGLNCLRRLKSILGRGRIYNRKLFLTIRLKKDM